MEKYYVHADSKQYSVPIAKLLFIYLSLNKRFYYEKYNFKNLVYEAKFRDFE